MAKEQPIEFITPPNVLKAKIGGALSKNHSEAIRKAEKALSELSSEFENWIEEEVSKLETEWARVKDDLSDRETQLSDVYGRSHDLKGLATTYGYPLVTRIANSLCKLIGSPEGREIAPKRLVGAHVSTCRVALRDGIKTEDNPIGAELANELERQVLELVKPPA